MSNPVEPDENFADKWNTAPEPREAFYAWAAQLRLDLDSAFSTKGLDQIAARLSTSFGTKPVTVAASALGATIAAMTPTVTGAGRVITDLATARPIPRHTFHGPPAPST